MRFKIIAFLIVLLLSLLSNALNPVLELDDRVVEYTKQGKWLLQFYAPWCGHCKKMEPIYSDVAKHYQNSNIRVARIDATRFSKAASHFEVRGYPMIKLYVAVILTCTIFNYNGDRKLNDIIDFVDKADGPRVRRIDTISDFANAKSKYKIFFLLVSDASESNASPLAVNYIELANKYFLDAYFFVCYNKDILSKVIEIEAVPTVAVVKEESNFYYENNDDDDVRSSMEKYIKTQQFLTFTYLSLTNFQNLIDTHKNLVILLISKDNLTNEKLIQAFKSYSEVNWITYKEDFQFAYTDNTDLLSGIAIWSLDVPLLFIFNTTTYKYSTIDFNDRVPDENDISKIINEIRESKIEFYGGDGWLRQMRRPFWELYKALLEMFREAPMLSLLVFGLPFSVISIVCYFLCCFDTGHEKNGLDEPVDSDDYDENDDNDGTDIENDLDKLQVEDKKTI